MGGLDGEVETEVEGILGEIEGRGGGKIDLWRLNGFFSFFCSFFAFQPVV